MGRGPHRRSTRQTECWFDPWRAARARLVHSEEESRRLPIQRRSAFLFSLRRPAGSCVIREGRLYVVFRRRRLFPPARAASPRPTRANVPGSGIPGGGGGGGWPPLMERRPDSVTGSCVL